MSYDEKHKTKQKSDLVDLFGDCIKTVVTPKTAVIKTGNNFSKKLTSINKSTINENSLFKPINGSDIYWIETVQKLQRNLKKRNIRMIHTLRRFSKTYLEFIKELENTGLEYEEFE